MVYVKVKIVVNNSLQYYCLLLDSVRNATYRIHNKNKYEDVQIKKRLTKKLIKTTNFMGLLWFYLDGTSETNILEHLSGYNPKIIKRIQIR